MYRKLVLGSVSVLGLMALVVSAQQPAFPRVQQQEVVPNPGKEAGRSPFYTGPETWAVPMMSPFGAGRTKEEFALARESETLARQFGKADADTKEKLKAKLGDVLAKQFDARQKRHEAEIAALEAQVKQLKDLVQKRQENRREIISRRFEQLVRDAEGLGW
jgi:hypothetical protein